MIQRATTERGLDGGLRAQPLDWIYRCRRCGGEVIMPAGYEPLQPCGSADAAGMECLAREFVLIGVQTSAAVDTARQD